MSDKSIIVCVRREHRVPEIPSWDAQCSKCGEDIAVALSSPPGKLICGPCAADIENVDIMVSPEQREELHRQGLTDEDIDRTLKVADRLRKEGKLR